MCNLHIKSDFTDYYDFLNNDNALITYNRYVNECKHRGEALKYLRNIGIKTLELHPVSQYLIDDGHIVVYTDTRAHHGDGKKLLKVSEAKQMYNNYIASKYYESDDGYTLKYLQIGKRRLTLTFKKQNKYSLEMGNLVDIKESVSEYNRLIGLPIFSIDYISNGKEMIATDFNEVENLSLIGIDKYIKAEDIIKEIIDSLTVYNKY